MENETETPQAEPEVSQAEPAPAPETGELPLAYPVTAESLERFRVSENYEGHRPVIDAVIVHPDQKAATKKALGEDVPVETDKRAEKTAIVRVKAPGV